MLKITGRVLAAALLIKLSAAASAAVITPELAHEIASKGPQEEIPVIIQLADRVNHRQYELRNRRLRDNRLVRALKDRADLTQRLIGAQLIQLGARNAKQLWIINGIAATLPARVINELAQNPAIGRIQYDAIVPLGATTKSATSSTGWNLNAIHATEVWAMGHTGSGVVIANMDTGVDANHPDLAAKWRGGINSWFDPYGQHATPYDFNGHGTQTMGLMVGGAASGTAIGVAPSARWIAVKIYNDAGQATLSNIHLSFQWLMDPDGNPSTMDAPDVVNASWGLTNAAPGMCNLEFNEDIQALNTAGIGVVFAAGNDGPSAASSVSPANNPYGYSAGAVDEALAIADQSSRGPSGCDGSIFPKLVAPGVNVVTSDLSFGGLPVYATVTGTSFAAPHVAGAMALLAAAFPAATVLELKAALTGTAQGLGAEGANSTFGYGLTNALAAYDLLADGVGAGRAPNITSLPLSSAMENRSYLYQVTATDPDGGALTFALDSAPAGMTIGLANGLISWTPSHAQIGSNAVAVRVTDSTGLSAAQNFSILVAAINRPPVGANDNYSVAAGSTLNVPVPGVLANDSDPDGNAITAVLASGPAHGAVTLNTNGSFKYVPNAGYSGVDSFSYRDSDGQTSGNVATVAITVTAAAVNKPPVAANDSYTAPMRRSGTYAAQVFGILLNDTDVDGTIDAATVSIASAPNQRGTVTVNVNGTVSYVPKSGFTGTESFRYKVMDNRGAVSNTATASVRVR
jgi:serine protease AprX